MPESHVLRWEEPLDPFGGHPVIDELKARPGEWAVIWEEGTSGCPVDDENAAPYLCARSGLSNVETRAVLGLHDERIVRVHARWNPPPRPRPAPYSPAERRLVDGGGA